MQTWMDIVWSAHVRERSIEGRRVCYLEYGDGPPVVLVHGLGGAWTTWLENIAQLGERHRVIAVDLPGFGRSDPLPAPAEMRTHAAVVARLLDELDVADAIVAGHSMGGLVVMRLAADRPDLVTKLVLVNAGGIALGPARLTLITGGFRLMHRFIGRRQTLEAVARRPRLRRLAVAMMVADPRAMTAPYALETLPLVASPGFLGAVTAAARAVGEVRPDQIPCPVLLLWGRHDRILPLAAARELLGELPDARLEILDGAGHCPMFEVRDAFNRAFLEFAA